MYCVQDVIESKSKSPHSSKTKKSAFKFQSLGGMDLNTLVLLEKTGNGFCYIGYSNEHKRLI